MLLAFYVSATCAATTFRARLQDRLVDMTGSERGGVAAEYAILIALIAVVIAAGAALPPRTRRSVSDHLRDAGNRQPPAGTALERRFDHRRRAAALRVN